MENEQDKYLELKKKQEKKEAIISYIISGAVALFLGAFIFVLYFFLRGHHFIDAVNGMALSSAILIGYAVLTVLARWGAFDTFAYGFLQLGHAMFGRNPRKYNSMADYKQAKYDKRKEKSKSYYAVFIVSVIFVIALIVLEIIYHTIIGQ